VGNTISVGTVYPIRSPDFVTHRIIMDCLAESPFTKSFKYRYFFSFIYDPFSGFSDMVYLIVSFQEGV
jgi:hypothetical protein